MNFLHNIFGKDEQPIKSYSDFWDWFLLNEKKFWKVIKNNKNLERDFFDRLSPKLDQIKRDLYFLTGMLDENTVELIITADGALDKITFAEELINSAPKIVGWKFTALKPASESGDMAINIDGYTFGFNNLYFYSTEFSEYPDNIDITIVNQDLNDENRNTAIIGTNIFLDNYLGELNFVTMIDDLMIIGPNEVEQQLIPIEKLKDFLFWREKEFIEKYDDVVRKSENDNFNILEISLENGNVLVAIVNINLLSWEYKVTHPWCFIVEINYDGLATNGMPDDTTSALLKEIEEKLIDHLKEPDGYLNIGRQTGNRVREIYFACKDFRKPSKIAYQLQKEYENTINLSYTIYKDKYWQSFNRFIAE